MNEHTPTRGNGQGSPYQSAVLTDLCYRFVRPLLGELAVKMDRRLVQTFFDLLLVIVIHRPRSVSSGLSAGSGRRTGRNQTDQQLVAQPGLKLEGGGGLPVAASGPGHRSALEPSRRCFCDLG